MDYTRELALAFGKGLDSLELEGQAVLVKDGDKVKIRIPKVEENKALHYAVKSAYMSASRTRENPETRFHGVHIPEKYWPERSTSAGNSKALPPNEREYSFKFRLNFDNVDLPQVKASLMEDFQAFVEDAIIQHQASIQAWHERAAKRRYGAIVSSLLKVLDKKSAIIALQAAIAQDTEYGANASEWAETLVNAAVSAREAKEAKEAQAAVEAQM